MERGVTGHIDHSATFWFCWSTLVFSFSFSIIMVGEWMDRRRQRESKEFSHGKKNDIQTYDFFPSFPTAKKRHTNL